MNNFQIIIFFVGGLLLLHWARSTTEKQLKFRSHLNSVLAATFILFSIYTMHKSHYVIFSNDGPLGQMKRAHDAGYSKMGLVAAVCFGIGILFGLLIVGCATKSKPEPPSDAELIEQCLQMRMNCGRLPHHQNPS